MGHWRDISAIRERRHFKTVEATKHTFDDLVDCYIRDVLPHKGKQRKTQGTQLAFWNAEREAAYAAWKRPLPK
jgi:hypothetical protein